MRKRLAPFLTTHAGVHNTFYTRRYLISRTPLRTFRSAANDVWSEATIAAELTSFCLSLAASRYLDRAQVRAAKVV